MQRTKIGGCRPKATCTPAGKYSALAMLHTHCCQFWLSCPRVLKISGSWVGTPSSILLLSDLQKVLRRLSCVRCVARKTYRIIQLFFRFWQPFSNEKTAEWNGLDRTSANGGGCSIRQWWRPNQKNPGLEVGRLRYCCSTNARAKRSGLTGKLTDSRPKSNTTGTFKRGPPTYAILYTGEKNPPAADFFPQWTSQSSPLYIALGKNKSTTRVYPMDRAVRVQLYTAVSGCTAVVVRSQTKWKIQSIYLFFKILDMSAMTRCTMYTKFTAVVLNI